MIEFESRLAHTKMGSASTRLRGRAGRSRHRLRRRRHRLRLLLSRRATVAPTSRLSARILIFSSRDQRRRRSKPPRTSTRIETDLQASRKVGCRALPLSTPRGGRHWTLTSMAHRGRLRDGQERARPRPQRDPGTAGAATSRSSRPPSPCWPRSAMTPTPRPFRPQKDRRRRSGHAALDLAGRCRKSAASP